MGTNIRLRISKIDKLYEERAKQFSYGTDKKKGFTCEALFDSFLY
jgi:hypothetical protein